MDLNISSAPYLANEQGLKLLREATAAVHIALNKINDLKKYVKQQRIMKADLSHPTPMAANVRIKSEPFDEKIDVISIDDDSDEEELSREIARTKTMTFLKSQGLRDINVNDNSGQRFENTEQQIRNETTLCVNKNMSENSFERVNNCTNDHSLSSNNDSQTCNAKTTLDVNSPNLQVYFTIIHNSVTEFDIKEAFEKEGFQDFEVNVKNKEYHSYGFIKFSNEESAKRAILMSLKILISGRTIKILPYNRDHAPRRNSTRSLENIQSLNYSDSRNHDSINSIDENILINISCGYERNRTNDTLTPRYEAEMNVSQETNQYGYTDPHYVCNEVPNFPSSQFIPSPNVDLMNRMFVQNTMPFHDNTNVNFSIECARQNSANAGSTSHLFNVNEVEHALLYNIEHDKNIQSVSKNNSDLQKMNNLSPNGAKNNKSSNVAKNKKSSNTGKTTCKNNLSSNGAKNKKSPNTKKKKNTCKKKKIPKLTRSTKKKLEQLVLYNPNFDFKHGKELLQGINDLIRNNFQ